MTIDDLRARLDGTVVTPDEPGWDAARLFHSGIGDPDLVVRAAHTADVAVAVRYAAEHGLAVSPRGGGHSAWGTVPGGLVIDLAALDAVAVDDRRVSIGGGATWGGVADRLAPHELAISAGDTASVGVGGATLGGGIGWMVRAWGLAADQLVGAELVTADGEVREVDAASAPDLFWALRGGGGNLGVVTRFDFAAHHLPAVVVATLTGGDPPVLLRALRDLLRDAPRTVTVTYMDVPPMDPSAPPGASVTACLIGDDVDGARALLTPLLAVPGVGIADIGVRPYRDVLQEMPAADPEAPAPGFVGGNGLFVDLDDDTIEALTRFRATREAAVLFLRSLGGAYGDVPPSDTPFPARAATWFAMTGAFDIPGLLDDEGRAAAVADWEAIGARAAGVYGNFTTSTDPAIARLMYPPAVRARLAALKAAYDPQNLFSRNHNVAPA